jgi:hypothetical protein
MNYLLVKIDERSGVVYRAPGDPRLKTSFHMTYEEFVKRGRPQEVYCAFR